jgi:hypothetical protein
MVAAQYEHRKEPTTVAATLQDPYIPYKHIRTYCCIYQ